MAIRTIDDAHLINIANAIRDKCCTNDTYKPCDMAAAINTITGSGTGGGGLIECRPDRFTYFNYKGQLDYMLENYGDQIKFPNEINKGEFFHAFYNSQATDLSSITLPAFGDIISSIDFRETFRNCPNLEKLPNFYSYTPGSAVKYDISLITYSMFRECSNLREVPEDFFSKILPPLEEGKTVHFVMGSSANDVPAYSSCMFQDCYSLRKVPRFGFMSGNEKIGSEIEYQFYYNTFKNCYSIDEILDFPVFNQGATKWWDSSNPFATTIADCHRLKNFTFQTQADGTPYTANWYDWTINLSEAGYMPQVPTVDTEALFTDYNSGLVKGRFGAHYNDEGKLDDPEGYGVKCENSYRLMKERGMEDNWYAISATWSRYNHDSAVRTINSLPDTRVAANSDGNTLNVLKLPRATAAQYTDEGAIGNLTEAEIAVATAKGWTVSFN